MKLIYKTILGLINKVNEIGTGLFNNYYVYEKGVNING